MPQATIMTVDDDAEALQTIERELRKRYSADYDIRCERSATVLPCCLRPVCLGCLPSAMYDTDP
jgi:hypothetical protein